MLSKQKGNYFHIDIYSLTYLLIRVTKLLFKLFYCFDFLTQSPDYPLFKKIGNKKRFEKYKPEHDQQTNRPTIYNIFQ